jgi:hypothetical protein
MDIVQEKYVDDSCFTGSKVAVLLADRCEAEVHLKRPCCIETVKVLVMSNPVYPLIPGNNGFSSAMVIDSALLDEPDLNMSIRKTVVL